MYYPHLRGKILNTKKEHLFHCLSNVSDIKPVSIREEVSPRFTDILFQVYTIQPESLIKIKSLDVPLLSGQTQSLDRSK
jgi:hypothetical protein